MEVPAGLMITGALVDRDDGFIVGRFATAPAVDDVCMAEDAPAARSGLTSRRYRFDVPGFLVGFSDGFAVGFAVGLYVGDGVGFLEVGVEVRNAEGDAVVAVVGLGAMVEVFTAAGTVLYIHTYII
jgi:hypothetical protein